MGQKRKSVRLRLKLRSEGSGLLNTLINKLPFELHIPGYQYCGPGTKLEKRLQRGDKGVNALDEACKEHDIAYSQSDNLTERHEADRKLYKKALERFKSSSAGVGERIAAGVVSAAMKGKTTFGMGARGRTGGRTARRRSGKKGGFRRMRSRFGGAMSFLRAMKKARNVLRRSARRSGLLDNAKVAYKTLLKSGKILPPRSRVIPLPKRGGFLPLIPLFAALGALGSLGGGAAAVAKAVNDAKAAREQLAETNRHNLAMEAATTGKGVRIGEGLYIKPYKSGCGLYIKPYKSGCGTGSKNY